MTKIKIADNVPKAAVLAILDDIAKLEYVVPKLAYPRMLTLWGSLRLFVGLPFMSEGEEAERRHLVKTNWLLRKQGDVTTH